MKVEIFGSATDEEVREWQRHPVTVAYIATLRKVEQENTDALVRATARDDQFADRDTVRIGGRIDGVNIAKRIAEEEVR